MEKADPEPSDVPTLFQWERVPVPAGVEDLTGRRFGMLVALHATRDADRRLRWVCRCDCGTEKAFLGAPLRTGNLSACGCRRIKDPDSIRKTRLYSIWRNMMARCSDVDRSGYGARGISVRAEWQVYEAFAAWAKGAGYTDALTIDRIDNDGGYEPGNCHWISMREQANNTRRTIWVEHDGESRSLADWAKHHKIDYHRLHRHIVRRGRSLSEAIARLKK